MLQDGSLISSTIPLLFSGVGYWFALFMFSNVQYFVMMTVLVKCYKVVSHFPIAAQMLIFFLQPNQCIQISTNCAVSRLRTSYLTRNALNICPKLLQFLVYIYKIGNTLSTFKCRLSTLELHKSFREFKK